MRGVNGWIVAVAMLPAVAGCQCKTHELNDVALPRRSAPELRPELDSVEALELAVDRLMPIHEALPSPQPGDWLAEHDEPGESFEQYRRGDPIVPDEERHSIYIQPLGDLNGVQYDIVKLASDYMERFFDLRVDIQPRLPLSMIPEEAQRIHEESGNHQILTSYVLYDLLAPRLPRHAAAFISFTASDLWPGSGWNFVFGQASLRDRVGVWSMHRNGNPEASSQSYKLALLRTLKIAVHETGHMFSLQHCTAFACVMNGANNQLETDRHPLWLCPHCMAKIAWATGAEPVLRYERLAEFALSHGFAKEAAFFHRSIEALR